MHRVDKQEIIANISAAVERFLDGVQPGFDVKEYNTVITDVFNKSNGYFRLTVDFLLEPKPEDDQPTR